MLVHPYISFRWW